MRLVRGSQICELSLEGAFVRLDGELQPHDSPESASAAFADELARRHAAGFVEAPDVVDDYDARLVYADELQLRGDPLGELIAVQHALATMSDLVPAQRRKLQRRVHGLLDEQHDNLFGPLAPYVQRPSRPALARPALEVTWHMGFADEVLLRRIPQLDLHEIYAHLRELPIGGLVTKLVFAEQSLPQQWVERGSYVELVRTMSKLGVPPHLRALVLGAVPQRLRAGIEVGDLRPVLAASPTLEELEVHGGGGYVGALISPRLRKLTLDGVMLELAESNLPSLVELTLMNTGRTWLVHSLLDSELLGQLRSLVLRRCGLDTSHLDMIVRDADRFAHLERFDVRGNPLSRYAVNEARKRLPRLRA
ncbi:MAG TPA: hypothetical protein VFQ53_25960 [Kofleriaceae bacterium]|nr:hypothetical protein [Kofleriaceae bacterium]